MQVGTSISDADFAGFQRLLYQAAGISMGPGKKALLCGRLAQRLRHLGLGTYGDYQKLLKSGGDPTEMQVALNLLTTNETYFFREPKHFDLLRSRLRDDPPKGRPFRVWSAACSTGEEVYTLAMLLADCLGDAPWEVIGSDISTRVLEKAQRGQYPMERTKDIPKAYLSRFCLRGVRTQAGTLLIDSALRARVRFLQVNLNEPLPALGEMDAIFLRNVMIYFDGATRRQVVERLLPRLRVGGLFFVGHSETLNGVTEQLTPVVASVYQRSR